MGLEVAFGKGRWMYWTILVAVLVAVGVIIARRKSPEAVARTRLVWGDEALDAKEYEQAIAFYKVAVDKDPTLYSAYFNLALAYEFVDDEKALAAWNKYIEVAGREPSQRDWLVRARDHRAALLAAPLFARALELTAVGDYAGARREYEAALALRPEDLDILNGTAANEAAAGDYAAAARYYERALKVAPYSMNIKYELARVYEYLDKGKAEKLYRELLEMSGTNTGITMDKLKYAQKRQAVLAREGYRG
jgi:tetratricopeptide (TPR) repeat protein